MLEAMARIAPSQPNEAIARIASRRNGTISLDPSFKSSQVKLILAPRGAWLRQKSCQEISCTVVALLVLKKCVSSDAL